MPRRATVIVNLEERGESFDVDIPLDINAGELLEGLDGAYGLGIDTEDPANLYVKAENPIVLLHGQKTLAQSGIMNGSVITISDRG